MINSNCASIGGCERGDLPSTSGWRLTSQPTPTRAPWYTGTIPDYTAGPHDRSMVLRDFWELAYDQGVDLWLNGHDHNYQRFAPQDPDGNLDPQRGIPQFLVGTGGAGHTTPTRVGSDPNLVVENHDTSGSSSSA